MASIKISDLSPIGSELFRDSESFLNELKVDEIATIRGSDDLKLGLFLNFLNHLSIDYSDRLTNNSIQTVFSNGINDNDFLRWINGNTAIGQSINGISIGNVNTV